MQTELDLRLDRMPIMAQRQSHIDASAYNVWRRARNVWGAPMKMILPDINEFQLHLTDDYWVIVDLSRNGALVLAWIDMEDKDRTALHEPIDCKLNYYHFAASAVRARSIDLMEEMLSARLKDFYH
ncbi:MAG: hypothetical protein L3J67_01050 [Hyphomicrobiaceae bacterium]|nr:hypothetical protein [Hyphomicrobiaceae bacterium]